MPGPAEGGGGNGLMADAAAGTGRPRWRHNLVAGDPDAATRREQARERLGALTPREREVAAAVGDGSSNAEIAARLHMSLATVKAHVSRLLVRLDADNRVQIALLVQDAAASRPR
jgi:DNA-binding NarL/FixJ family response regulator